jgi:AcrR family transcriptional regulator
MGHGQPPLREQNRLQAREVVLDAAERLLDRSENSDFSMRELAAEAGVGFATPFNHFGSKNAIMQALSTRLIERMAERFRAVAPAGDAIDRVLAMGQAAIAQTLERPVIAKAVVGSLGVLSPVPSNVRPQSQRLWSLALDDHAGIAGDMSGLARVVLPEQLAYSFRGCLSFWIAGEIGDERLAATFETGACTILLGFASAARRADLVERIRQASAGATDFT